MEEVLATQQLTKEANQKKTKQVKIGITSNKKEFIEFYKECDRIIISLELFNNLDSIDGYDRDKIITPVDVVVGAAYSPDTRVTNKKVEDLTTNDIILDIGIESIALFKETIEKADSVKSGEFIFGAIEMDRFNNGTNKIQESIDSISEKSGKLSN